jgi:hypothetical protein
MLENLDNLRPAPKVTAPPTFRPGIEFDGTEGTATTPGFATEPESFDEFLISAGMNPDEIDVIPPIRTSRWQQREDGAWLTSYRFSFRRKAATVDLPALFAEARRAKPSKPKQVKREEKALLICPADFQVGKTGSRGGTAELLARVMQSS